MSLITRNNGYRLAAGKEEQGIAATKQFFKQVFGVEPIDITDSEENYRHGDLRIAETCTVEVKSQPIDPAKYSGQNFVEVFEETEKEKHAGGKAQLCQILHLNETVFANLTYYCCNRRRTYRLDGLSDRLSVSLVPVAGSTWTVYVNPYCSSRRHIYLYRSSILILEVQKAVMQSKLLKGSGKSNNVTYGVKIPIPPLRWTGNESTWQWSGDGVYPTVNQPAWLVNPEK